MASTNAIVAYATIVTNNGPNQKIYGTPFPKTCTCVLVDEVVDEKALLPIPIPNMYDCVGDAVGAYAAWPTHLMVVQNKVKLEINFLFSLEWLSIPPLTCLIVELLEAHEEKG